MKAAYKELKPLDDGQDILIEAVDTRHETVKDIAKQQSVQEKLKAAGLGNVARNKRRHKLKGRK